MGLDVFGFPLQQVEFCITGKEVLTTFCKEIKIFLQWYKSSWQILKHRVDWQILIVSPRGFAYVTHESGK